MNDSAYPTTGSLSSWLQFLEQPKTYRIDLGLERVKQVAKSLGVLKPKVPVITVAGTNGKGSTVESLSFLANHHKLTIGTFTSPHIFRYNERIRINGHEVSDENIVMAFDTISQQPLADTLSYFEWSLLAALLIFSVRSLDLIVLEVGLGGRLDATNIIDPSISIITCIGLEHCEFLGNTREAIAVEKAGIMRPRRPVVCADACPPDNLQSLADSLDAPFYQYQREFGIERDAANYQYWDTKTHYAFDSSPQLMDCNFAAALRAWSLLELPINMTVLQPALSGLFLRFRQQVTEIPLMIERCKEKHTVIIDAAHNADSIRALQNKLAEMKPKGRTLILFSMLKTKDMATCIAQLKSTIDKWFVAPLCDNRSHSYSTFQSEFLSLGSAAELYKNIPSAYSALINDVQKDDLVVICGSFSLIKELPTVFHELAK